MNHENYFLGQYLASTNFHLWCVVTGMPPPKFTHISFVARKVFYGHASLNACSKLHYRINFLLIGHICCCYHRREDQLYDTGKQKQLWAVGRKYEKVEATPQVGTGLNARNHRVTFKQASNMYSWASYVWRDPHSVSLPPSPIPWLFLLQHGNQASLLLELCFRRKFGSWLPMYCWSGK